MDKKKLVGLCIVNKNYNYGSILQSYATLMKLEEMGIKYEIINYNHPRNVKFYLTAINRFRSKDAIYSKIRLLKRKIGRKLHPNYARNDDSRKIKFDEFIASRFISFSKPIRDYSELEEYSRKYTDVLVGSDQLWLPSGLDTNFYNLMFVPNNINKIAYSASFGVSKIPHYQEKKTKTYLERINYLSVREQAGAKIINDLTQREAKVILDPTMVVNREIWDKNITDRRIIDEKYIFCYFLGNNPSHRDEVRKLASAKNLKIVVLKHLDEYIPSDEKFGDISPYDVGPAEFVNLIRHAEYICTDSFHGSVFSIIYKKKFISFNRYVEGKNSRNSRLDTLFNNIGISRRFRKDIIKEIEEEIDWEEVEKRLGILRKESSDFIEGALNITDDFKDKEGIEYSQSNNDFEICEKNKCTGCSVCESVCPKKAITIKKDCRGFYIPLINYDTCIACKKCKNVCPANNQPKAKGPTRVFAYQNTDNIRFNSTSGGFFNAIACQVISEGGVVCGAAFDDNMLLKHIIVEKKEQLAPLQKSKYVQSLTEGIFEEIKRYLEDNRKVLFVGVGCQAAALRNYIGDNKNLIIVDLICYGVPSSGLFEEWIKYLEKKYGKVKEVRFRDKSYGYYTPNIKVIFDNKKFIESCRDSNLYTDLMFRHLSIRNSCYSCMYKTIDRISDFTLGDLWFIEQNSQIKNDNLGTTAIFTHSVYGEEYCRGIGCVELKLDDIIKADAQKMVNSVSPAYGVNGFWKKYEEDGFEELVNCYCKDNIKTHIKFFIKRMANKIGLSKHLYKKLNMKKIS